MRFCWLGLLVAAGAQAAPLTLAEAIRVALKESPSYDSAAKTTELNELQYKNAVAKLLPSIDFTSTDGLQNNVPISSNSNLLLATNPTAPWYSTLTLGATETLYDNGVSLTNLTIADLSRDLARVNELKARDSLALSVAMEFYNFSLATALLKVRKQQQSMLGKQYDILSSQYQQGFKTRADFLRMKTQVQQAEIDSITAENTIAQSAAHLIQLLGVNQGQGEPVTFSPIEADDHEKFTVLEEAKPPNLDEFYDNRAARIQEEINDRSVDLAWRNYFPQATITTGVSYNNQNYIKPQEPFSAGNQMSWQALLTLQYNLWDFGSRRRSVEIARVTRDTQADALNLTLQQTQETSDLAMADLARVRRSYRLSQQLLHDEQESNTLVENQYREGKVTYLDLITSLNSLLQAKVQFFNVYFSALQDLAQLDYYEGKLYESLAKK